MLPEVLGHKSTTVPGSTSAKTCFCGQECAGQVSPSWGSPLAVPIPPVGDGACGGLRWVSAVDVVQWPECRCGVHEIQKDLQVWNC